MADLRDKPDDKGEHRSYRGRDDENTRKEATMIPRLSIFAAALIAAALTALTFRASTANAATNGAPPERSLLAVLTARD